MTSIQQELIVQSGSQTEPALKTAISNEFKLDDLPDQNKIHETLYLVGRPTLKQFLRFIKSNAADPQHEGELVDEWKAANKIFKKLETEEAGIADHPTIKKLDMNEYKPLMVEFLKDPLVHNGFNTVPTEVAIVELDRFVVYQHHIDLTYTRQLENAFGHSLSKEQIFKICLLHKHPKPPVKWSRIHGDTWVFMSPSNDLRYLGIMNLEADNIKDYPLPGNVAGIAGIAVGFGSNFLNAIYVENRLILNNGSHRAYTLRKLGVTHVPCIVQHVSSREELDVVASSEVAENPEYYLKHPRPSLLKDYLNPKLRKIVEVNRELKQILVKFKTDSSYIPTL